MRAMSSARTAAQGSVLPLHPEHGFVIQAESEMLRYPGCNLKILPVRMPVIIKRIDVDLFQIGTAAKKQHHRDPGVKSARQIHGYVRRPVCDAADHPGPAIPFS